MKSMAHFYDLETIEYFAKDAVPDAQGELPLSRMYKQPFDLDQGAGARVFQGHVMRRHPKLALAPGDYEVTWYLEPDRKTLAPSINITSTRLVKSDARSPASVSAVG
ncbi:MAG: hypothetical protein PHD04_02605 [Candidatus Pacebacteria bacterium]|jgi:hypothetical protein|nr:hypothetical protein [Candidatus Paceibacterota bacterium]MDD5003702.1 hypothetical protein [Acidithiobacillus sp.]MDD5378180.1 hypothetical protein [Acidithiobacillus sp.]MDD5576909.1 hypothetical protein [Acidithiobacillus sp.]